MGRVTPQLFAGGIGGKKRPTSRKFPLRVYMKKVSGNRPLSATSTNRAKQWNPFGSTSPCLPDRIPEIHPRRDAECRKSFQATYPVVHPGRHWRDRYFYPRNLNHHTTCLILTTSKFAMAASGYNGRTSTPTTSNSTAFAINTTSPSGSFTSQTKTGCARVD